MSPVLDTTVLIDALRRPREASEFLETLENRATASEVSRAEFLQGLRSHERREAERLMHDIRWIPVDESIARRAGELGRQWRRSHSGIDVADLVIAATAQLLDLPLATANVRHFPMFEGLAAPY